MALTSIVIPAKNEEKNIEHTLFLISSALKQNRFDYEIIVVDDGSGDHTAETVTRFSQTNGAVRLIRNLYPPGFGNAIKTGLEAFKGDHVIITMADLSDDPDDVIRYIKEMRNGYDCCFGSRWGSGAAVENYPPLKLLLNRSANTLIRILFGIPYNDVTNAFKGYSRTVIDGIQPIRSEHFNITVELPLKAIIRGYSYQIIATSWRARKSGVSHFKINEMGSKYLWIILSIFREHLSRRIQRSAHGPKPGRRA